MFSKTLFVLFFIHIAVGLERVIFFNELASFLGGLILLYLIFIKRKIDKVHTPILLMFFVGFLSFCFGFLVNDEGTLYQKLRTTPFVYSILCYFVGFYFLHQFSFQHFKYRSLGLVASLFLGGKLAPVLGVIITSSNKLNYKTILNFIIVFLLCLEFTNLMIGNEHGSSTLILIFLLVLLFRIFTEAPFKILCSKYFSIVVIIIFIILFLSLNIVYSLFQNFYYSGFSFFSGGDSNMQWRLMFWAKLVGEMTVSEIFTGIKLATPLFDPYEASNAFIVASEPEALNRPYTLGPHNSFVYLYVRMGVIYLLFFVCFLLSILKKLSKLRDTDSKLIVLAICSSIIALSFNVFLETSLYAGIFWALIGLSCKHIKVKS